MLHAPISVDLLARYDVPGPRYTSYPPATAFTEAIGPAEAAAALSRAAAARPGEPLSAYVHLPFCRSQCLYCGCSSVTSPNGERWGPYLDRLLTEIALVAEHLGERRGLAQLHWGGGSPSWLPPEGAARLVAGLTGAFRLEADAEIALEADPRTLRPGQLEALRALGFNRLSLGVQDLQPEVQQAIGRVQPEAMVRACFDEARALGFASINLDVIYGLPYQTPETFRRTVETLAGWRPERLAVFGYAHVPWMRPHQRLLPEDALPGPRERLELFATAVEVLLSAGYEHLGLDHFVVPEDELARARRQRRLTRNFQGYSIRRAPELIGLGATAIGDFDGVYAQNQRGLQAWDEALAAGRLPVERGLRRTVAQEVLRRAIQGLMCYGDVDLAAAAEAAQLEPEALFGAGVTERLDALAADGLVERSGWRLLVLEPGRLLLRNVAMALDPEQQREKPDGPRFSRTV